MLIILQLGPVYISLTQSASQITVIYKDSIKLLVIGKYLLYYAYEKYAVTSFTLILGTN